MPNIQTKNAGFFSRFLAQMIDTLILGIPEFIALYFIFQVSSLDQIVSRSITAYALVVFPMWLLRISYYVYFLSKKGKTIGKATLGLEVRDAKNTLLRPWWIVFREMIAKSISGFIFGLGFLWIIKDTDNLGWHDYLAGTKVLKKEERTMLGIIILLILLFIHISLYYIIISSVFRNTQLVEEIISTANLFYN